MSIEFPCSQCGKLLRVGDDAAGKQARCPSCSAVQSIPVSTAHPESPFGSIPAPPAMPVGAEVNPYQAPAHFIPPHTPAPQSVAGRPIQPTIIGVSEVFESAWTICRQNFAQFAMCLALMVLCIVINYAAQFVFQMVMGVVGAANAPLIVAIPVLIIGTVALMVFQIWIGIGQTIFFLKTARGQETSFALVFAGGPYLLSMFLATLVITLVLFGVALLCAVPAGGIYLATREPGAGIAAFVILLIVPSYYILLTYYQYYFLIPDQGMGALEALQVSKQITSGNRLTLLLIYLCIIPFFSSALFSAVFRCSSRSRSSCSRSRWRI